MKLIVFYTLFWLAIVVGCVLVGYSHAGQVIAIGATLHVLALMGFMALVGAFKVRGGVRPGRPRPATAGRERTSPRNTLIDTLIDTRIDGGRR